ncbi:hypothetical protein BWD12_15745 [Leptospira santarosai serovar Bananal]|nr:hypothetical protein BWD11_12295 [Leptospira santarosai serovar Grippotyphosa]ONF77291.1 hypothetical protein BWD12_15745 [Leptospira santarosai serovar Bananal]ONF82235.1 hypothetical protein BWD13_20080 [Leptospira santarosai serovar Grippotyphosa]
MANVLGVSRSGFYQFLKRSKNELEKYNPELVEETIFIYLWSENKTGFPRLSETTVSGEFYFLVQNSRFSQLYLRDLFKRKKVCKVVSFS